MPQYLRAFVYDSTQTSGSELVKRTFDAWQTGEAISILPGHLSKSLIDDLIIKCDPNEVHNLTGKESYKRDLAIVETPDLSCVVLTSGTTGKPLPVELGFTGMKNSTDSIYAACGLTPADVWLCCLPPFYIAGLAIFARCFISGSRLVFHKRFDVDLVDRSIKEEGVTAISLVPYQLKQLIESEVDLSPLKTILVGGAKLDENLRQLLSSKNLKVTTTYGLTETWGGICHDGKFLDNSSGRIVDGELQVFTSSLMLGYRHNAPATHASFTNDNWFKTKDIATIENGILNIEGRLDDQINSGGVKVDPHFVESAFLKSFPELESCIVGTEHKALGSSVTLCLVKSDSSPPTLELVRERLQQFLPKTHLPTRLAVLEFLPKTISGKLQRKLAAEQCEIFEDHFDNR